MIDYIIVGAAQAGLTMAYHLKKMNKEYLVVDRGQQVGESWLNRWDSLKLFTPTEFNHLEGMPFPAPKGHYPNKYEVADYFKQYVRKFEIPIRFNTLITSITKKDGAFTLNHPKGSFQARHVIIATGPFHTPYTPPFATKLSKSIYQIHSNYYKNPEQLQDGDTLVVGGGDSGFQILDEISGTGRRTYFSGPSKVNTLPQEILGKTLFWWFKNSGLLYCNKNTWLGEKIMNRPQPIIGTDVKEILSRQNVISMGMSRDAEGEDLYFEKGKISSIRNIIWATGYRPNFNWIEGLQLDQNGYPKNQRGVSTIDGLYFIGLPWMYTRGSATLGGVKNDARYLTDILAEKQSQNNPIKSKEQKESILSS